jgi:putative DNA primase/helicase
MWPKRPDEHVEEFLHRDDDEFATLRRKLLRFADDQAKAIAEISPIFPSGFNNRVSANWKLPLAIAELAGGDWPERARKAAEHIAGKTEGSQGARLFEAFHAMCAARLKSGAAEIVISSDEAVAFLKAFDPYWANDYRGSDGHPGEITKHKLAALLHNYELGPQVIHPTKRADMTRGGYGIFERGKWDVRWIDLFARYCPGLPNIQTLTRPHMPDRKKRK